MSVISGIVLGAIGASVIWIFIAIWLVDVIGAQRKALSAALTTLRLYRETRDHSDTQVRELLGQNARLALQLIDRAAASSTTATIPVPQRIFHPTRES
jgi:hypothetical protein